MKVIGVTGCVGVGKSTVCQWFAAKGYSVIDTDQLSAESLEVHAEQLGLA